MGPRVYLDPNEPTLLVGLLLMKSSIYVLNNVGCLGFR